MKNKYLQFSIIIFILAFFINVILEYVFIQSIDKTYDYSHIDLKAVSMMQLSGEVLYSIKQYSNENNKVFEEVLSTYMLDNHYQIETQDIDYKRIGNSKLKDKSLAHIYSMIFGDIQCFPVKAKQGSKEAYYYNNSFLDRRTYGGERKHMGIDIMDEANEKGALEIVSMTDGVITSMGWLELGGYRIGVTTKQETYFYYAHLDRYHENLKEGDYVKAGQILGYMGSTGYGPEGTMDQFPVHLHLGIMLPIPTEDGEDYWINPYPVLRLLEIEEKAQ